MTAETPNGDKNVAKTRTKRPSRRIVAPKVSRIHARFMMVLNKESVRMMAKCEQAQLSDLDSKNLVAYLKLLKELRESKAPIEPTSPTAPTAPEFDFPELTEDELINMAKKGA